MFRDSVTAQLADLPLGDLRIFDTVDSTNDELARWAGQGAPDLALVIADAQTAGRGRQGRHWFTPPQAALAFSLLLRHPLEAGDHFPAPQTAASDQVGRLTALGALAVCQALESQYHLPAQIKWPNDVLLSGKKAAGILAEAQWENDRLLAVILGLGVNISPAAVPPATSLIYPATCVETVLGYPVDRLNFLHAILAQILQWKDRLAEPAFLRAWEDRLAFRGEWVTVSGETGQPTYPARLLGLDEQGCLKLQDPLGRPVTLRVGELHLRPGFEEV